MCFTVRHTGERTMRALSPPRFAAVLLLSSVCLSLAPVMAQDTRSVSEPSFAPSCTVLTAQLASVNGDLPPASENSFDTGRIQTAINNCPSGQAVELALG